MIVNLGMTYAGGFAKIKKVSERILNLIEATILNPTEGIGKPEHLKYLPGSTWSRRITQEHRLVYQISSDKIIFTMPIPLFIIS